MPYHLASHQITSIYLTSPLYKENQIFSNYFGRLKKFFFFFFPRGLWCIDDVPFRNKIPYLKKLPGQIYSIDEQCQHEFGPNTRYCNGVSLISSLCAIQNTEGNQ